MTRHWGDQNPFGLGLSDGGQMETAPIAAITPFAGLSFEKLTGLKSVQVDGRDTVTFPAVRDEDDACRCGMCPGINTEEKGALLSCGPGVVTRMWRERVRNGQWLDIRKVFRDGRRRVHEPAVARLDGIHNNLDCGWNDIAAAFRADQRALTDGKLAGHLRVTVEAMEADLAEMRRASAERWGTGAAA